MTEKMSTAPYVIQISEQPGQQPIQTMSLTEEVGRLDIQLGSSSPSMTTINDSHIFVDSSDEPIEIVNDPNESICQDFGITEQKEQPCVFQIVYPQELNLSRTSNTIKRGRPKKRKQEGIPGNHNLEPILKPETSTKLPKSARTRSGRLVKLPKHMEKDFKKIDITMDEHEIIQVSDFKRFEEKENSKVEFTQPHTKKRVISAQYKCPKCNKAYLGKSKMIQHLKKYPDHGPLPEGFQEFNFDVWNYLFDITQKCKPGQRGAKFCEELSNLLHNVQLLKSALFKVEDCKNFVQIDKVLGNAIGLSPGRYKFDENELYKDVTVLKLITNSDFFKPNINNKDINDGVIIHNEVHEEILQSEQNKKLKPTVQQLTENFAVNNGSGVKGHKIQVHEVVINATKQEENVCNYEHNTVLSNNCTTSKADQSATNTFSKKVDIENQILHSDLLNENLLLHALPAARNPVDDLILTSVDNNSNLLDNSTSSDEVMNVDQFVNERFKKIIEPDIELSNTSLNLDLPSLELFQFHTT